MKSCSKTLVVQAFGLLSLVALAACSGADATTNPPGNDPGATNDAGSATNDAGSTTKNDAASSTTDSGTAVATCSSGTILTAGQSVTTKDTGATGNPQRDYCIMAPANATELRISVTGGSCSPYKCMGSDLHLALKKGSVPDALDPDAQTKEWTYGPDANGFATFVKSASPGPWYLSLTDDANTLGYKGVSFSISFK